jgi:tripartite-type tricarboxylate transporter receptor subunit TctC
MAEAGLPGVQASLRFVLMAPAGTPKEAIAKLQTAVAVIVKEAEIREALNRQGFDPLGTTAEETAATLRQDYDRWGPILKAANIKLD